MNEVSEFWNRVKAEVYASGNNFEWLYLETGMTRSTLATQKRRGTLPKADDALKIAKALNVTLDYLITGKKGDDQDELLVKAKKYEDLLSIIDKIPSDQLDTVKKMLDALQTIK